MSVYSRAGVSPGSPGFYALVDVLLKSSTINLHGFYGHAGDAYASTSLSEASEFLSGEVAAVNDASRATLELITHSTPSATLTQPFILSVGSTPTAHAASMETRKTLSQVLHGTLELHAGNYPMLDLQQQHTTLVDRTRISQRVQATVISYYPGRGNDGSDEALIDAGAIAFSKDTGPSGGYGDVIGQPWRLSKISQEHGILTRTNDKSDSNESLKVGMLVNIVGQHACLIAAVCNIFEQLLSSLTTTHFQAYPWYYIVDGEDGGTTVVDIWVPWKGW
jgi:D-serine deaminase-like pyridoxal phosphate-dependent protein